MVSDLGEVESKVSCFRHGTKKEPVRVIVTWGCLSTFVQGRYGAPMMER